MHVLMRVFSSVGVGVGVVVLDMFVLVAGVRVRVSNFVVVVFVGVRFVVTFLMLCHCALLWCEIPAASIVLSAMSPGNKQARVGLTASCLVCIPRGAWGVEQCAWASGAMARTTSR
jgi:hypothetical protein